MEWLDGLKGHVVGIDTSPFINFIEEHPTYLTMIRPFFEAMEGGEFQGVTSIVTLLEVLVHPIRQKNISVAQQYRDLILNAEGLTTILLSEDIAEEAAALRAEYNLRTPDAIQMATAIHQGASFFLTNDSRLPSLDSMGILLLNELLE